MKNEVIIDKSGMFFELDYDRKKKYVQWTHITVKKILVPHLFTIIVESAASATKCPKRRQTDFFRNFFETVETANSMSIFNKKFLEIPKKFLEIHRNSCIF